MATARNANLASIKFGQLVSSNGEALTEKMAAADMLAESIEWKPNRRVLKSIPPGFRLPLQVVRGADGLRRFFPRDTALGFLVRAACGGQAVLQRVQNLTKGQRQSYRLMSFLFRWSFSNRRLMSRTIRRSEDLRLRQSECGGDSDRDILPNIETIDDLGKTNRLTPEQLLRCGRQSACDRGILADAVSHQVNLGLLEMAHCSPIQANVLRAEDSGAIIRISLFGLNQGEPSDDAALKALIEERLIEAVHKHLNLSAEEFRSWMWSDFDNIVQQLAKRRSKQGSPVSRQQVRFILFDLLWRSFGHVSQCVEMQMQAVRQSIEPALTDQERRVFGLWYDGQRWTADLAPITLSIWLGLLQPTWADLEKCDAGDDRPWRAFLQALQWSSAMAENRRRADVIQKRRKGVKYSDASEADEDLDEDRDLIGFGANDDCDDWIAKTDHRRSGKSRRRRRK